MAQAYVPSLDVLENTVIRRERRLPLGYYECKAWGFSAARDRGCINRVTWKASSN